MNTTLDCVPCIVRQALQAARFATADEAVHHRVLQHTATLLAGSPFGFSPIELGREIHHFIRTASGSADPYAAVKRASNQRVLALLPRLEAEVRSARDPLLTALRYAAIGNVIDYGADPDFDLDRALAEGRDAELDGPDFRRFVDRLQQARRVLYLGDNAGEIVFDRLLVGRLALPGAAVTFVVRGAPVLNDVTLEDARAVRMEELAEVITTGDATPGTLLHHCSEEFRDNFDAADLIVAKGQGNFEGLAAAAAPLFFLLRVKCPVVGGHLGVPVGRLVFRASPHFAPASRTALLPRD